MGETVVLRAGMPVYCFQAAMRGQIVNLFQNTHAMVEESLLAGWNDASQLQLENAPRTTLQSVHCLVEVQWERGYQPACPASKQPEYLQGLFNLLIFVPANEGMMRANQLAGLAADIMAHKTWRRGLVTVKTAGATIVEKKEGEKQFSMRLRCAFRARCECND